MSKVVIIGSGLGGLSCGIILARNGHQVTILEQAAQPGGCMQCFTRHGAKFETGIHYIGAMRPGETAYRLLNYLGAADLPLSQLDPDGYDVVSVAGKRYKIANGRQKFVDALAEHFPEQRDNLERYYDAVQAFAREANSQLLRPAQGVGELPEGMARSVDEVIAELIPDPELQRVLVGQLPLYAGEKGKTPFATHAFIADFYSEGAYRIVGGSDALAQRLLARFSDLGGKVLASTPAAEIVCDGARAIGVRTAAGELHEADWVISTIHPARMVELVPGPQLRPAYRRRMQQLPNTAGSLVVYLKFKPEAMPYMRHNFFGYPANEVWDRQFCSGDEWPGSYLYMHMCPRDGADWAESGILVAYMLIDELKPWLGTRVGRRGKDYEEFKRQRAQRLLDVAEVDFPGLRDAIECINISTPLTYLDYTGTADGALYGTAKDVNRLLETRVSNRTRIPNLLLAGQSVSFHGLLGVLVSSVEACSQIIPPGELLQQIAQANGEE